LISPSVYYAARKCKVPVVQTIHNFRLLCPNGVLNRNGSVCEECIEKGLLCSIKNACYRESKIQTAVVANMLALHRIIGTYNKIDYIFLTEFNRHKFRKLLGASADKHSIKPNFEYIDRLSQSDKREDFFVYIGRLDKNKGIDFLIDNWNEDKELYVFGNGALENEVTAIAGSRSNIHYMGFQPQQVIWEYLAKATAMVFPTDLYEGFPMTIIESFAFGTPVICSDIGNGADIIKAADAGVAYECRNKQALYNAIEEVENNFDEYSNNALRAYDSNNTPEANYRIIKRIYERITNKNDKRQS